MDCLECKSLEAAFRSMLGLYVEARSAAYFQVSTELAAKKNDDMERARNNLEEHQSLCASIADVSSGGCAPRNFTIVESARKDVQRNALISPVPRLAPGGIPNTIGISARTAEPSILKALAV
jgi:hypothetical protein